MAFYLYLDCFEDTDFLKAADVIAGIWVLANHAITLQLQMFFGTLCLCIWKPV